MQIPPAQNSMAVEIGPLMNEQIPLPGIHVNNFNLVHFDMDAQNIFIFNSDNDHRGIPVFKVSFGFLTTVFLFSMYLVVIAWFQTW